MVAYGPSGINCVCTALPLALCAPFIRVSGSVLGRSYHDTSPQVLDYTTLHFKIGIILSRVVDWAVDVLGALLDRIIIIVYFVIILMYFPVLYILEFILFFSI